MHKEKVLLTIKLVIVYSVLLGLTALPLLFQMLTENSIGRLLGRMFTYLLMAGTVFVFYKNKKKMFTELGYSTKNWGKQVWLGGILLVITISIFVLLPLLCGVSKEYVLSVKQQNVVGQIIFFLLFVGPIEEFVFRGYFQQQLEEMIRNKMVVCVVTSLLFGFMHFPSTGNFIHVAETFVIGLIYSVVKTKWKDCTIISVSLAHGLHDSIIFILSCILL